MDQTADVMTVEQMTGMIASDLERMAEARQGLEDQLNVWEFIRNDQNIGGPGGAGREEIRAAMFTQARPKMEAAEERAAAVSGAPRRNAFAIRSQLGGDRIAVPEGAQVEVNERLPLVAHKAATLPLAELVADVRAAIATGDAAGMYLYARTATARTTVPEGVTDQPREAAARVALARMLDQIRVQLRDTSLDDLRAQIDGVLEQSHDLESAARWRQKNEPKTLTTLDGRPKVAWPRAS